MFHFLSLAFMDVFIFVLLRSPKQFVFLNIGWRITVGKGAINTPPPPKLTLRKPFSTHSRNTPSDKALCTPLGLRAYKFIFLSLTLKNICQMPCSESCNIVSYNNRDILETHSRNHPIGNQCSGGTTRPKYQLENWHYQEESRITNINIVCLLKFPF